MRSRAILHPLGAIALAGASLLAAGCNRPDERAQSGSDSTATASSQGRDAANTSGGAAPGMPGDTSTAGTGGSTSSSGATSAGSAGTGSAGTGPADSTVSGTGMGGGNPNGQGTGDSSTRSNVPAGALPDPAASAARDGAGVNRGSPNSR